MRPRTPLPAPLPAPLPRSLGPSRCACLCLPPAAELFSFCRRSSFAASVRHTHTHIHTQHTHTHTLSERTHNSAAGEVCPKTPAACYNFYFSLSLSLSESLFPTHTLSVLFFVLLFISPLVRADWVRGREQGAEAEATLEAHQILNSLRLWHTIFGLDSNSDTDTDSDLDLDLACA